MDHLFNPGNISVVMRKEKKFDFIQERLYQDFIWRRDYRQGYIKIVLIFIQATSR